MSDSPDKACWNTIGVWSKEEKSCQELNNLGHCKNCPVYSKAGRNRLSRLGIQAGMQEANAEIYANPKIQNQEKKSRAVVFAVSGEYFSISCKYVSRIVMPAGFCRLPHNNGGTLDGIVNIEGEIKLVVSLKSLLGLGESRANNTGKNQQSYPRLLICEHEGSSIAIAADDVIGVHDYASDSYQELPETLSQSARTYLECILDVEDKKVGLLDMQLLIAGIQQESRL